MERSGVPGRITLTKCFCREMELAFGVGDYLWTAPSYPYPIWYNLFGATPLTTKRSPWVWVEMDSGKVITGRVIDFGLDDPDAGSLVLVMVTVIVGGKRPQDKIKCAE